MQETNKITWWIIVGLVILALLGYWVYQIKKSPIEESPIFITNFEDCVAAGYPVTESYPRQCRTSEGNLYIEEITDEGENNTAIATDGCYIGGCSQQICSDQPDAVSTCEYRPEYSCYKSGICGRQTNGKCGWTETPALTACLELKIGNFSK